MSKVEFFRPTIRVILLLLSSLRSKSKSRPSSGQVQFKSLKAVPEAKREKVRGCSKVNSFEEKVREK